MAEAATALLDIEDSARRQRPAPATRRCIGVITPDPQELKPGPTGVGTRVTLKDGKDKVLADLVIGKEVRTSRTCATFARPTATRSTRSAIKTDKLSTKFDDWIEKDLLKLNAFDVARADDQRLLARRAASTATAASALRTRQPQPMKLAFDDAKSNWSLIEMDEVRRKGRARSRQAGRRRGAEHREAQRSEDGARRLADRRRRDEAQGLSQDLRASDEFVKDNEAVQSLVARGFFPVPRRRRRRDLSSEGEATCTTKDGVRYVLRFGNLAGGGKADESDEAEGDKPRADPALEPLPVRDGPVRREPDSQAQLSRARRRAGRPTERASRRQASDEQGQPKRNRPKKPSRPAKRQETRRERKPRRAEARRRRPRPEDDQRPPKPKPADKPLEDNASRRSQARRAAEPAADEPTRPTPGRRPPPAKPEEEEKASPSKGEQAQAGRVRRRGQEGPGQGQGAQRPLRRLVLHHLRRRLQEDPPRPRRHREEEVAEPTKSPAATAQRAAGSATASHRHAVTGVRSP